jgi:tRNA(Glu) U13 pseudouridine synthase TruD
MRVYFVLPKGAYATTVLSSAVDWETPANVSKDSQLDSDAREAESE